MSVSERESRTRMRIGFVTLQYPPHDAGGIGSYVQTVATEFARAGHEVTVVCAARGQARSTAIEDGVVVERFPVLGPERLWRRMVRPEQLQRVRIHHALTTAWAVWRTRRRFDVLEVPEWKAQPLLLRGVFIVHLHLPLEVHYAWLGVAASWKVRSAFWLERIGVSRAARMTATSRQTSRLPDGSAWVQDDQVTIVPPPIALAAWEQVGDVRHTTPTVLYVGRLEGRKAPELLIDALALLASELPDVRAVFVGRPMSIDGRSYTDYLAQLATESGVACEFRPQVNEPAEMRELYEEARVVAVPSRYEPLSMVALEALASGRPVVMTEQVGAREWVSHLFPDSVVPGEDPAAFADALRPHLESVEHAREAGRRGRALIREICAPSQIVDTRLAVYRSALERRGGAHGS